MMKTFLITFLAITFISCNTTDSGRPYKSDIKIFAEDPFITGKITHIGHKNTGQDSYLEILIEENPSVQEPLQSGGKKISLTLTQTTEIFSLKQNGNVYYYPKEDLKVGQIASGWLINGIVLDSYPQQGGAKRILVFKK
ncbi:YobA family protein [Rhodohalobacter sp. 614A]|uniref:YobA family protein n=1 Tax=Rhodohalobacter sp. 614A TaxID=2908649 RepID=UPI001F171C71|nr:YobA family protein [Rhodohalobacter sp. 614A]